MEDTVQVTLDVIENEPVLPLPDPREIEEVETSRLAEVPDWVTVTVLVIPPPETVTVAFLELVLVLAELAVTLTVPLLEPDVGDTPSQV